MTDQNFISVFLAPKTDDFVRGCHNNAGLEPHPKEGDKEIWGGEGVTGVYQVIIRHFAQ